MSEPTISGTILAFTVTLVALLLAVAPAQAVQLQLEAPAEATVGDTLLFGLGIDIEAEERLPFSVIFIEILDGETFIDGCAFNPDGSPLDECERFTVTQTHTTALDNGSRIATGFEIVDVDEPGFYTTDFGTGEGYGDTAATDLGWDVQWNSAGFAAGEYAADFTALAAADEAYAFYTIEEYVNFTLLAPDEPEPINDTDNETQDGENPFSVDLYVKEHYPKGGNYVFICTPSAPVESFDWDYGDGSALWDIQNSDTYHTYTADGSYPVTCGATTAAGASAYDTIVIDVDAPAAANLYVKEWYPQGNEYTFVCGTEGMDAESYDWEIRHLLSGEHEYLQYDIPNSEIFHRFRQNGQYLVSCTASGSDTVVGWMEVMVSGAPDAPVIEPGEDSDAEIEILINESSTTLVIPPGADNNMHIDVPAGIDDVRIDLTQLLQQDTEETSAFIPMYLTFDVETGNGNVHVIIPAGMTIYSTTEWDGIMTLPKLSDPPATLSGVTTSIELGSDEPLWFDKAVRLAIEGQAGTQAAYVEDGAVHEITLACVSDVLGDVETQLDRNECKLDVEGDLVIYTKHFTQFVTYETPQSSTSGSSKSINEDALPPYVRKDREEAAPAEAAAEEPAAEDRREARDTADEPAVEADVSEVVAAEPVAETMSEPAPAITGRAAGSDAVPTWMKALGVFTLALAVVAALVVQVRRK